MLGRPVVGIIYDAQSKHVLRVVTGKKSSVRLHAGKGEGLLYTKAKVFIDGLPDLVACQREVFAKTSGR